MQDIESGSTTPPGLTPLSRPSGRQGKIDAGTGKIFLDIAVLPGDGIGPEVIGAALAVLKALECKWTIKASVRAQDMAVGIKAEKIAKDLNGDDETRHRILFPELHHPLLVAGEAKMPALAGESQKVLIAAIFAFHTGKAVVQISTVQVLIHDIPEIRTEESVGPLKLLFVPLDKGFKMIPDATVIIGGLRISEPINGGWDSHDSSPPRKTGRL